MINRVYGVVLAVGTVLCTGCQPPPPVEPPPDTLVASHSRAKAFPDALFPRVRPPSLPKPTPVSATCEFRPTPVAPASRPVKPPPDGLAPTDPEHIKVALRTNKGEIALTLNPGSTPCTVLNFVSLAEQHFYDNTACHRVTIKKIYLVQCGDPSGTGTGGPGYSFADEYPIGSGTISSAHDSPTLYPRGTIAMANSGPDTNGSQFFVTYKDSPLPPHYTIFGSVEKNSLKIIDATAKAGVIPSNSDENEGQPKAPLEILSLTLP